MKQAQPEPPKRDKIDWIMLNGEPEDVEVLEDSLTEMTVKVLDTDQIIKFYKFVQ